MGVPLESQGMPLTCVGKKEILEKEKHQQIKYVYESVMCTFPFLL